MGAFMFIEKGATPYREDMRLNANAEFGDPGACRRR
jgi:hypothetical protein